MVLIGGIFDAAALKVEVSALSGGGNLSVESGTVLGLNLQPKVSDKAVMQLGSLKNVVGGSCFD